MLKGAHPLAQTFLSSFIEMYDDLAKIGEFDGPTIFKKLSTYSSEGLLSNGFLKASFNPDSKLYSVNTLRYHRGFVSKRFLT